MAEPKREGVSGMKTTYVDEIQDPVTGEFVVLEAATPEELDDLVAARFGIAETEQRDAASE